MSGVSVCQRQKSGAGRMGFFMSDWFWGAVFRGAALQALKTVAIARDLFSGWMYVISMASNKLTLTVHGANAKSTNSVKLIRFNVAVCLSK
ncbi:hypothetical protein [Parapedobacter sp. 10938]|uniref:hypothetical protein n=1 Tax=Parapedobacter flavus TaxID=3110225 RepID=UPI002DB9933A|nr:hypothetical protein [Parapedobacter sp. 10938]MEC3881627.1 hypothetical protein [Parapedobacter sp. 10938]